MLNYDWVTNVHWESLAFKADFRVCVSDYPDCVVAIVGSYANLLPSGDLGTPRWSDRQAVQPKLNIFLKRFTVFLLESRGFAMILNFYP